MARRGPGQPPLLKRRPEEDRSRLCRAESDQFTQKDPIGIAGGMNLYGFADGDPINFSDPLGLCVDACILTGPSVLGAGLIIAGTATALTAIAHGDELGDALSAGARAARDFTTGVWAAVRDKQHEKHLGGTAANIETHFGWLSGAEGPGKDPNRWGDKWKNDIRKGIREMRQRVERLRNDAKREQWEKRIEQFERRLRETKGGSQQ
jgi:hypothetical protein